MEDIKTDWIPILTPPVYPGKYDVKVREDLISEVEMQADWEKRLGQWGFWKVESWLDRTKTEMLNVTFWRGRELPHRVKLIDAEQEICTRRRVLLKQD